MKYFRVALLAIVVIGLLSGCGREDLGNSYVEGKDHQYMWESADSFGQTKAKGENGYFFLQGSYIYYLPEGEDILVPLCNQVDCMHTKEIDDKKYVDCNAYVGDSEGAYLGISFYDGYLYFLKTEWSNESGTYIQRLYHIKEDGSEKEVVYEWNSMIVEDWCLHRGEFFYTEHSFYENEETREMVENFCVKKISLDDISVKSPKLVYEAPKDVSIYILSHLNAYGNYLYFYVVGSTGTVEDSMNEDTWLDYHYSSQVAVNILTDEKSEVAVPNVEAHVNVSSVTFWQDKLVYLGYDNADERGLLAEGNIYISELDGSDAKVLLKDVPQGFRIMTDDNYLYLSNTPLVIRGVEEKQIYQVYDIELQLVDVMEIIYTTPSDKAIGDENGYYFFKGVSENEIHLVYFDKSTIGSYQGKAFSYNKVADWKYANADLEE